MSASPRATIAPISYPKLPFEIEAEQSALGTCFLDSKLIPEIEALSPARDFYDPLHRKIAEAIFAIDRERRPVTPLTVKAYMGEDAGLAAVGGHVYLASL